MNNRVLLTICYAMSLAGVFVYKKLVLDEPWAIGWSQVLSLYVFLTVAYIGSLRFEHVRNIVIRFFTEADSPVNLAFFRIVFFGYLLSQPYDQQVIFFSEMPKDLQFAPMGMGWLLPHLPINASLAVAALTVCKVACFFALIGLFTRASTILAAVTGFYVLGIPQFYGNVSHSHHIFWFMVIFAVSRCADVLSIDAVRKGFQKADRHQNMDMPAASVSYALPLRFFWILIGICYFFPGFWKLWNSGTEWIFGNNLVNHMYYDWMGFDQWLPVIRIDQWPWLCQVSGAYVIFFEMAFIFMLFSPLTRYAAMFMGILFHNMTLILLNIDFLELQICYVSFLKWDSIFRWMGKKFFGNGMVVLYDGSCSFCRRAIAFLLVFDVFRRIEYIDLHSASSKPLRLSHKLSEEQLMKDMHAVIGSEVFKGFDAYQKIASRVPLLWPIIPFLFFGFIQSLGHKIYRKVADHRACRIPPKKNDQPAKKTSDVVLISVALFMIGGSIYFGCIGKGFGWPFACYPTFSEIAWDRFRTIECQVDYQDGTQKILRLQSLKSHMPIYKLEGLIARIFNLKDIEIKNKKFKALWQVLVRIDPELNKARTVHFYFLENYTNPSKWHLNPINRTLAFEFKTN